MSDTSEKGMTTKVGPIDPEKFLKWLDTTSLSYSTRAILRTVLEDGRFALPSPAPPIAQDTMREALLTEIYQWVDYNGNDGEFMTLLKDYLKAISDRGTIAAHPTGQQEAALREALKVLNEALEVDQEAVTQLLTTRYPANENLVNHPTIQCDAVSVSALGLINGLFGISEKRKGYGFITIVVDDETKKVTKIMRTPGTEALSTPATPKEKP